MKNPVFVLPDALNAFIAAGSAADVDGLPSTTIKLVHLRASQINGCSVCTDMHSRELRQAGESDERLFSVAAWRDTSWFSDAERAALALTEAMTRIADRADPVSDDVWTQAEKHYDERALAGLLVHIALINAFNRLNSAVRQIPGQF
jgi:AhpD family alkylhydroperoxidase